MVCNVAPSRALRAPVGDRPKARAARGMDRLRMEGAMEPASDGGLGNTASKQCSRKRLRPREYAREQECARLNEALRGWR